MAKSKEINMKLPALDDLFSTQEERDEVSRESVRNIPISEINDFPNHPFKVKMDENMSDLVDSIKEHGVLVPALVRPKEDGTYEFASELAELEEIPCIIRDLTDDEATLIMVDSNLQRERILPSEKAFAYKMKLDAMKRQGKRNDLTSRPVGEKLYSVEALGKEVNESARQIHRYIRLAELIQPILDMVDDNKIAMRPAVELSYLSKTEQDILLDTMQLEDCTPSHAQAIKMRKFSEEGRLNEDVILSILSEEKASCIL